MELVLADNVAPISLFSDKVHLVHDVSHVPKPQVSDFGISRSLNAHSTEIRHGTLRALAPELIPTPTCPAVVERRPPGDVYA